ncbi:uncharacterized protein TNCV_1045121 [Trichonephila clavipes]|nr:uncharacterized protein TNCV_1045121 [Trichonephila clavipes]
MIENWVASIKSLRNTAVTGSAYLDALQLWLFPHLEEREPNNFIWQQYDDLPHWHLSVRDWLNITVPNRRIGSKEPPDKACIARPSTFMRTDTTGLLSVGVHK